MCQDGTSRLITLGGTKARVIVCAENGEAEKLPHASGELGYIVLHAFPVFLSRCLACNAHSCTDYHQAIEDHRVQIPEPLPRRDDDNVDEMAGSSIARWSSLLECCADPFHRYAAVAGTGMHLRRLVDHNLDPITRSLPYRAKCHSSCQISG